VYDISLGGLSLVLNARIPGFDIGTIYNNCELDLREYGVIPLVLKVRNQLVARSTSGAEQRRVGVEFVELDSRAQTLVQRYIAQQERERRAMGRDD
jgi:c-di-GMP-binding flagellar brake protein YcgR